MRRDGFEVRIAKQRLERPRVPFWLLGYDSRLQWRRPGTRLSGCLRGKFYEIPRSASLTAAPADRS